MNEFLYKLEVEKDPLIKTQNSQATNIKIHKFIYIKWKFSTWEKSPKQNINIYVKWQKYL